MVDGSVARCVRADKWQESSLAAQSGQGRAGALIGDKDGDAPSACLPDAPTPRESLRSSAAAGPRAVLFRRGEIDEGPTSPQLVLRKLPVPLLKILLLDENGRERLRHAGVVLRFRRASNPQCLRLSFSVGLLRFPLAAFSRDHGC